MPRADLSKAYKERKKKREVERRKTDKVCALERY